MNTEDTRRAARVFRGHLAIIRIAAQPDLLAESVIAGGDAKARKHLLARHFFSPIQVPDGLVDGFNQPARPDEALFHDLPMRLEGSDDFEISPPQDSFDLLQLEAQLAIEQDLLEGQELWLFVEPVTIRTDISGLQQACFIVEMKRAHAHARHRRQLFDGVCHHTCPAKITMSPRPVSKSTGSRYVRVK
jgi:hypothetical protein